MKYAIYCKAAGWRERWTLHCIAETPKERNRAVRALERKEMQTMVIPCTAEMAV